MGYRVTGVGAFGFSLNWEKAKGDKQVARAILAFLENRRLLFGERHVEDEMHCVRSAIEIRNFLTEQLAQATPGKSLSASIRAIRRACMRFVEAAGPQAVNFRGDVGWGISPRFANALGELRALVAAIASQYDIEIEEDLASVLPLIDQTDQISME